MANLNTSAKKRTYDAIVIGSGISGGWAAKELTEKGLKTLILDRGKPLEHIQYKRQKPCKTCVLQEIGRAHV